MARKFGLTYAPEGLLNKHPHASRLSPTLYGTGRKMRLAIRRVAWGVCAAAVCYFVAAMFLGWNDAVPLFVLLFSSIVIVATDEDDGKAIGVLVGLAALLMLVLHVVDLGPFFDAIGLR